MKFIVTRATVVAVVVFSFDCVSTAVAEDTTADQSAALAQDLAALQGTWESSPSTPAGPDQPVVRIVKRIEENRGYITYYDAGGNVVRSHTSKFKLEDGGSVRIYTYFDTTILEGPRAGESVAGPASYIYRVVGDTMHEVHGMLVDGKRQNTRASLLVWRRVLEAEPAP